MKLLLLVLLAFPVAAADVEAGVQHVGTLITGDSSFDGGDLDVESARGFGASAEVFWNEHLSTRLAGTFINPVAVLNPGDVDLNTVSLDIYSLSARYHFAPRARLSPYAGAGAAYVSFGNLEERFADDLEMNLDPEAALLVEAGVRYRFRPRLFFELGVTYMPLEGEPIVVRNNRNLPLPRTIAFDPLTVSAGAAWRF
jgi:outer membrane protein W